MLRHNDARKSDPPRRRLWAVLDPSDPTSAFTQKIMPREQAAGVTVGAHPEQDQVESRVASCVCACKGRDKLLLVVVGAFVGVVEQVGVQFVNFGFGDRDF